MASDRPTATELIETVREFLEGKALGAVSGHMAFQVRIAASLLAIAQREIQQRPRVDEEARARLCEILGNDGSLEELEAELVTRIREGDLGSNDDAVLRHLWQTAEDKLRIANPKYLEPH